MVVWLDVVVVELLLGLVSCELCGWELVSGVVDCVEGEVLLGVLDCGLADCELVSGVVDCGVVDELLCATTQTADSSRTAVIRDTFLIYILLKYFRPFGAGL